MSSSTSSTTTTSAVAAAVAADADERLSALHAFDDTKTGVKGLVEAGATTLPSIFLFPPHYLLPSPCHLSIPTIDLSLPHHLVLPSLVSAAREWGIFQLTNHSIALPLLRRTLSAVRSFHSLPPSTRSSHYNRSNPTGFNYFSNVDLFHSAAASWMDSLKVENFPAVAEWIPEVCREELVEWDMAATAVARRVVRMLAEGMGVGEDTREKMGVLERRVMGCHCYPPCPMPEKTMGMVEHKDADLVTVLIQDESGGLQVKKIGDDGEEWWVDVKPVHGSILVLIGELFQIISNDELKSPAHRVVANSGREDRISIALFLNPGKNGDSDVYGPLPELVWPEKPTRFRSFTMAEFLDAFYRKMGSSLVEHFRANSSSSVAKKEK